VVEGRLGAVLLPKFVDGSLLRRREVLEPEGAVVGDCPGDDGSERLVPHFGRGVRIPENLSGAPDGRVRRVERGERLWRLDDP
jgi:hypothetical protein